MSLRGFLKALFGKAEPKRGSNPGDKVAKVIREAMGPLAGGDAKGGHATGSAVYKHLEGSADGEYRETK